MSNSQCPNRADAVQLLWSLLALPHPPTHVDPISGSHRVTLSTQQKNMCLLIVYWLPDTLTMPEPARRGSYTNSSNWSPIERDSRTYRFFVQPLALRSTGYRGALHFGPVSDLFKFSSQLIETLYTQGTKIQTKWLLTGKCWRNAFVGPPVLFLKVY